MAGNPTAPYSKSLDPERDELSADTVKTARPRHPAEWPLDDNIGDPHAQDTDKMVSASVASGRPNNTATTTTTRQRLRDLLTTFCIVGMWYYTILGGARRAHREAGSWSEGTLDQKSTMAGAPILLVFVLLRLLWQFL